MQALGRSSAFFMFSEPSVGLVEYLDDATHGGAIFRGT
jgi:hypothetical protein